MTALWIQAALTATSFAFLAGALVAIWYARRVNRAAKRVLAQAELVRRRAQRLVQIGLGEG